MAVPVRVSARTCELRKGIGIVIMRFLLSRNNPILNLSYIATVYFGTFHNIIVVYCVNDAWSVS